VTVNLKLDPKARVMDDDVEGGSSGELPSSGISKDDAFNKTSSSAQRRLQVSRF
jgi:hypothetical protein